MGRGRGGNRHGRGAGKVSSTEPRTRRTSSSASGEWAIAFSATSDAPKRFITALGADPISQWARQALEADGDVAIQEVKGGDAGPPLYLALMESGSLKVGASDFRIVEQSLSADFVISRLGDIGQGDFLVLDANLSPRLLADLARRYADRTRLVFEPVSVEKAAAARGGARMICTSSPRQGRNCALSRRMSTHSWRSGASRISL